MACMLLLPLLQSGVGLEVCFDPKKRQAIRIDQPKKKKLVKVKLPPKPNYLVLGFSANR